LYFLFRCWDVPLRWWLLCSSPIHLYSSSNDGDSIRACISGCCQSALLECCPQLLSQ
jgi:hypothetical protein